MNAAATAHATAGRPLSSRYHSSPHSPLVISEKQLIVAIVVAWPPRSAIADAYGEVAAMAAAARALA